MIKFCSIFYCNRAKTNQASNLNEKQFNLKSKDSIFCQINPIYDPYHFFPHHTSLVGFYEIHLNSCFHYKKTLTEEKKLEITASCILNVKQLLYKGLGISVVF